MRFIIDVDGSLFSLDAAHYAAHVEVTARVGWARLDGPTFRRLTRTKGEEAPFLPGAPSAKVGAYRAQFGVHTETDEIIQQLVPHAGAAEAIDALRRYGSCTAVTTGTNTTARRSLLDRAGIGSHFGKVHALDPDPRVRKKELRSLADGEPRTLIVTSADSVIRAAGSAELLAVGLSCGTCTPARLHRAGADVVYPALTELVGSLDSGAPDLIRAGLLPAPLGS